MALKTRTQIIREMQATAQALSPQEPVDSEKGLFFALGIACAAGPLAETSADIARVAQLSTFQFPNNATGAEASAMARAFSQTLGQGGQSSGLAVFVTGTKPLGTQTFQVTQGTTVATNRIGGLTFEAIETRALSAANADNYFNPRTRKYELPVLVRCLSAGTVGNIAPFAISALISGANNFETATNLVTFSGGSSPQSVNSLYLRTQQKLQGLDQFSKGGLIVTASNVDVNRITAISETFSSEYPNLFYRLPDGNCVDLWMVNAPSPQTIISTYTAVANQSKFVLLGGPVIGLVSVTVNGASAGATLTMDESLSYGRSPEESSYVTLLSPASGGDVIAITYVIDSVPGQVQVALDGELNSTVGALFSTSLLCRYARTFPIRVAVTGTVLGTFDPTTIESQVTEATSNYISQEFGEAPALGGVRSPQDLRDFIRAAVPGIAQLNIPTFCRAQYGDLVETISIPRNTVVGFAETSDLTVRFT
jgi:hypothetical protein